MAISLLIGQLAGFSIANGYWENIMGDDLRQHTQFLGINHVGSMNNHTWHSFENCLRYATLRKRLPHKNCVWWTAFATQFLLRTMCDAFNNAKDKIVNIVCNGKTITNGLTWKIVCDVSANGNVFLRATMWDVYMNETFCGDWPCGMYLRPNMISPV